MSVSKISEWKISVLQLKLQPYFEYTEMKQWRESKISGKKEKQEIYDVPFFASESTHSLCSLQLKCLTKNNPQASVLST